MATDPGPFDGREDEYPTSDGMFMAETDTHRDLMVYLIQALEDHFEADPYVYVSGNLPLFYEQGNKKKHVSPDVFVTRGISSRRRDHYLLWIEGKGPDVVIEITSKATRLEDVATKMDLYRDVLRIAEYFLFDPFRSHLTPPMQGYRLVKGIYEQIGTIAGRLPSEVLGLYLEPAGTQLRLFDPQTGRRLPTAVERERQRAEAVRLRVDEIAAKLARLQEEIEALSRRNGG